MQTAIVGNIGSAAGGPPLQHSKDKYIYYIYACVFVNYLKFHVIQKEHTSDEMQVGIPELPPTLVLRDSSKLSTSVSSISEASVQVITEKRINGVTIFSSTMIKISQVCPNLIRSFNTTQREASVLVHALTSCAFLKQYATFLSKSHNNKFHIG